MLDFLLVSADKSDIAAMALHYQKWIAAHKRVPSQLTRIHTAIQKEAIGSILD